MAQDLPVLTVSQLNEYIKSLLDDDRVLGGLYIKGEISNFTAHKTGHLYFSIKDEGALLKAVMFRSAASKLKFAPENGLKIIAKGRISAFVRDGTYQLYVDSIQPDGVGALTVAYEQLKRKLAAEGLFDESRKKPLPKIPTRIGVITSPTGAAVRDIINILTRRFPYAKMILYPALVQGEGAAEQLIAGVEYFNRTASADVLIIGRGGGSMEDLWAFNDERLARTVAASRIPIISAVGHEIDFTICDFVADRRAPTPSAAAELAVPETGELMRKVSNIVGRMEVLLDKGIKLRRQSLSHLAESRVFRNPACLLDERRMLLLSDSERLQHAIRLTAQRKENQFASLASKLDALNPMSVLLRGYSAVFGEGQKLVKSVTDTEIGDRLTLRTADGAVYTKVTGKEAFHEQGK